MLLVVFAHKEELATVWERSSASPVMNGLRPNRSEHSEHLHEFIPGVTSYFVP